MKEKLIATICSMLVNVLSSAVYDTGKRALKVQQEKQFQENFQLWLEKFFSNHIEPVFETSAFYNYVEYQKPFQEITRYLLSTDDLAILEETFLKQLVSDCKDSIIQAGRKCSIPEESIIYELFQGVLRFCKDALREKVSDGDVLILHQQQQSDARAEIYHQDMVSQVKDLSTQVENLLAQQGKITDATTIEKAYILLSDAIWDGRLEEVRGFLPLLAGKNDDLESSIKIMLSVLSNDKLSIANPLEACSKIKSSAIRDDIFRLLILDNYEEPEKLIPYVESIKDETLRKIAVALANGHMEQVIILTEDKKHGVVSHTCGIVEGLESEAWLTHRLCIRTISKHPARGSAKVVRALVGQPNFVDQLCIWSLSLTESAQSSADEGEKMEIFREIAAEMQAKAGCYSHARVDLQTQFYHSLLEVLDFAGDERLVETLETLPENIATLPEIEVFRLVWAIRNGSADQDTIIKFVFRTEQYWLLAFYCDSLNDCQQTLGIIHQAEYLIGKSPDIFDCAVVAICQTEGKSTALTFLKGYEKQYATLSEFWIRAYQLSESDESRQWAIDAIISGISEEKLQYRTVYTIKQIITILCRESKYTEALDILLSIDAIGLGDSDTVRMKIEAYMNTGRQIDALAEIERHYEELKDDVQILDTFLAISLNYKRPVAEAVLARAKRFKNARILMLAAQVELARQNPGEAGTLAMQSMLTSRPEEEYLFIHAFQLLIESPTQEVSPPSRVTGNTYFVAENQQDHSRLTFCIYREHILPHANYQWKDAQHIDMDNAVSLGFMRLSIGDTVEIQGNPYTIIEIGPLAGFYFRICADSLKRQKLMWQISAGEPEEMLQGIVKLFQENPQWSRQDWIQNYSNLSQIACSIYLFKSGSSLEYGQLMRLIVEDPSVVVREYVLPIREDGGREFVITYTALVVLHQLGIDLQKFRNRIIIPSSVVVEAQREADKILKTNSRDIVASLGVRDEQVQFIQPTEKMIQETTQKAVAFKQYAAGLTSVENTQDIVIPELRNTALTDLVGVCDYDALVLAHTRDAALVTCEMMTAGLTLMEAMKSDAVGLADFLCLIDLEITTLMNTLKRMLQYRFYAVITPTVIRYIIEVYNVAEDEKKQVIEKVWNEVLAIPGDLADEYYLKVFSSACFETIQLLKTEGLFSPHPIIHAFNLAVFHYCGGRIEWGVREGNLYYRVVHIDPKHTTADIELSGDAKTDSPT